MYCKCAAPLMEMGTPGTIFPRDRPNKWRKMLPLWPSTLHNIAHQDYSGRTYGMC